MSSSEWAEMQSTKPELALIKSVGFLVSEDKTAYCISLNHDTTNDLVSCAMNIPKAWVKKKKILSGI